MMAKPYTVTFGPWVPDGADIAFEADGEGAEVPLADCLNMYWANGTYQNLPTAASYGVSAALAAQCLGAFTAIDTSGNPKRYAGTSTDLYAWNGSAWVSVSKSAGAYATSAHWSFAEFGGCICAANGVTALQDMAIGSSAFADISAAPIGSVLGVINQSLLIGDITSFPYRVQWSAIADPTTWPTPLTDAAIAAQSGYQDLTQDWGNVMFIASGPQYGIIFQRHGMTRATYVGGDVVFSFVPFERRLGLIARNAAVQWSNFIFFIADDGFHVTDGSTTDNIGQLPDGSIGIDRWFWDNVNQSALTAISAGYDADKKSVFWAIPTGVNTLPDTLLTFHPAAKRWTRSAITTEFIFTDNDGTRHKLGIFDQTHKYSSLSGATQSGYIETYDIIYSDQRHRTMTGIRPFITGAAGTCRAGARNAQTDAVTYTADVAPDSFSRISPVFADGVFLRARVTAQTATKLPGAALYLERGSGV